ncbi:MAG: ImmA/IrrE family metallo-endopeptidase [Clostridiales bacterium]|jgi:Zn-dependent peptidase ImmA (M78 family)|nr:ImmA/IrrE family metallo-endopeptidase [Clostridiales bacterium]MDR2713874.1 ImmA/IrrE family metallo-endopeptidase [Clostridiales bacterium]
MNSSRQLVIEKNAENARNEYNAPEYGFADIFEASEKIGYRTIRYPIGSDALLGFSLVKDSDRIVFSNSSSILSREIFTIAHEIGHQRLHLSESGKTLIKDEDFSERNESEVEANYFAACLLMPSDRVKKFIRFEIGNKKTTPWDGLDIARIQTAFSISYDMAIIRLKAIDILNEVAFKKLRIEKLEQSATKFLNVIGGNINLCRPTEVKRVPAEFLKWVISNYNDKLIPKSTLQTALSYVDLNADDIIDNNNMPEEEKTLNDLIREMD